MSFLTLNLSVRNDNNDFTYPRGTNYMSFLTSVLDEKNDHNDLI